MEANIAYHSVFCMEVTIHLNAIIQLAFSVSSTVSWPQFSQGCVSHQREWTFCFSLLIMTSNVWPKVHEVTCFGCLGIGIGMLVIVLFPQVSVGESRRHETIDFLWIEDIAFSSLQCLNAVGRVEESVTVRKMLTCHLSPRSQYSFEQLEDDQVHLKKVHQTDMLTCA